MVRSPLAGRGRPSGLARRFLDRLPKQLRRLGDGAPGCRRSPACRTNDQLATFCARSGQIWARAVRVGKTPSKSILLTSALPGRRQSLSHDEGKDWVDHADLDYRRCADVARNWPNQRQHIVTNADLKSGKSRSAAELAVASAAQQTKVKRFARMPDEMRPGHLPFPRDPI